MKKFRFLLFAMMAVMLSCAFVSCGGDDDNDNGYSNKMDYDILNINGKDYACYGYRCIITYTTLWDLKTHTGVINIPCGELSDAKKGEYDYDYLYGLYLEGSDDLKTGSKLEDFNPELSSSEFVGSKNATYQSGSARVVAKSDDAYITVKFENFKLSNGKNTYTFTGTVQLDLDED